MSEVILDENGLPIVATPAPTAATVKTNKAPEVKKPQESKGKVKGEGKGDKKEGTDKSDKTSVVNAIKKKTDSGFSGKTALELDAPSSGSVDAIANDLAEAAKEAVKDDIRDVEITATVECTEPVNTDEESPNTMADYWNNNQTGIPSYYYPPLLNIPDFVDDMVEFSKDDLSKDLTDDDAFVLENDEPSKIEKAKALYALKKSGMINDSELKAITDIMKNQYPQNDDALMIVSSLIKNPLYNDIISFVDAAIKFDNGIYSPRYMYEQKNYYLKGLTNMDDNNGQTMDRLGNDNYESIQVNEDGELIYPSNYLESDPVYYKGKEYNVYAPIAFPNSNTDLPEGSVVNEYVLSKRKINVGQLLSGEIAGYEDVNHTANSLDLIWGGVGLANSLFESLDDHVIKVKELKDYQEKTLALEYFDPNAPNIPKSGIYESNNNSFAFLSGKHSTDNLATGYISIINGKLAITPILYDEDVFNAGTYGNKGSYKDIVAHPYFLDEETEKIILFLLEEGGITID